MLPIRTRRPVRASACLVFAFVSATAPAAGAVERQWHVGAGFGGTSFVDTYELGPSAGIHAAYGLSDMFDARFESTLSRHGFSGDHHMYRHSLLGGLIYKLDVIEWVPYFGVLLGYSFLYGETAAGERGWLELALPLGLDYAFSPHAAVGVEVSSSLLLGDESNGTGTLLVHAEYRWGF